MPKAKCHMSNVKISALPALFIGRFQPFHLGHLDAIKQILKKHKKVIIGIGSSQYKTQPKNPFSAKLRMKMIKNSLIEAGISNKRFCVVKIPDIHNSNRWVAHIERLSPRFDVVYSGTQKVQKLFKAAKKYKVVSPKMNFKISATQIRIMMKHGKNWSVFVPMPVVKIIKNQWISIL